VRTNHCTYWGHLLLVCLLILPLSKGAGQDWEELGPSVHVAVTASDSSGGRLHYRWRSTDGRIANVDSRMTTWSLPRGPGLHFAYVLVSNGRGGYTERRIGINTDSMQSEHENESPSAEESRRLRPPPAPSQGNTDYFRGFITGGFVPETGHLVYAPGVLVYMQDENTNARYPATGGVRTNIRGQYVIPGVPRAATSAGNKYALFCSVDGGTTYNNCDEPVMLDTATPWFLETGVDYQYSNHGTIAGSFVLQDGNPCGLEDEFFGIHSHGTATLLDAHNVRLAGPATVNEFGDFLLPDLPGAASIQLRCEGAQPILAQTVSSALSNHDGGLTRLTGVSAPVISTMSATLEGKAVGTFLPPPHSADPAHPFASDVLTRSDGYLSEKGIDSRISACEYYRTIGAVEGCDAHGTFTGAALTYASWQRAQNIGVYARSGTPQYSAAFINRADLNLARQHTSISYGPDKTAAVVCNHLGPPATTPQQLLSPAQSDIDTAVFNAVNNKNLVACVAMDYTATPGVNDGQPFVRFLIFGPSGELLPSVNLDGRSEKFVPGTCVVCHGGDHYQGRFPEDGSGFANIGAHFLPYDTGNFEFAQKAGLRRPDQEESIYHLNQNVLKAGPTLAEVELISGWYETSHVLNQNYIPDSWLTPSDPGATAGSATLQTYQDFYTHVVARACRTCHAAMIEGYNFDHEYNIDEYNYNGGTPATPLFIDPSFEIQRSVCGGQMLHGGFQRLWMMPNSLVTFNRLWNSNGTPDDQVAYLNSYLGLTANIPNVGTSYACGTTPAP
jgi:hypothetical protein